MNKFVVVVFKRLSVPDQDFIVSDFGAYLPSVKHLGLVHYAAGRALGLRAGQVNRVECSWKAIGNKKKIGKLLLLLSLLSVVSNQILRLEVVG